MNTKSLSILTLAVLGTLYGPSQAWAASILGTADNFGILAGETVTNSGTSIVSGNIGVSPGSAVTGFPPGIVIGGTIHTADAVANQAQIDATAAYNSLASQMVTQNLTGQDLGGKTLTPGVYRFDSSAGLTGNLKLNAQGNSNALFVFQIGSTLTTASSSSVSLINGGPDSGVYWQVGSSATLGSSSEFRGNILALTSISLDPYAHIGCGRALAQTGSVTMANTNRVYSTHCGSGLNGGALATTVPLPAALPLLGAGLAGLTGLGFRRRRLG